MSDSKKRLCVLAFKTLPMPPLSNIELLDSNPLSLVIRIFSVVRYVIKIAPVGFLC